MFDRAEKRWHRKGLPLRGAFVLLPAKTKLACVRESAKKMKVKDTEHTSHESKNLLKGGITAVPSTGRRDMCFDGLVQNTHRQQFSANVHQEITAFIKSSDGIVPKGKQKLSTFLIYRDLCRPTCSFFY